MGLLAVVSGIAIEAGQARPSLHALQQGTQRKALRQDEKEQPGGGAGAQHDRALGVAAVLKHGKMQAVGLLEGDALLARDDDSDRLRGLLTRAPAE